MERLTTLDASQLLPASNEDQQYLIDTVNTKMPFGKYAGSKLIHLPEPYLVWFNKEGFPHGKLGQQLELMYEIKLNGLEKMLAPLITKNDKE